MMVSMNVQTNIKTESARTQSDSHIGLWYPVKYEESMSVRMHSIYYYMDGIFKSVDRCTGLTPNAGHILKVRDEQCVWAEGSRNILILSSKTWNLKGSQWAKSVKWYESIPEALVSVLVKGHSKCRFFMCW